MSRMGFSAVFALESSACRIISVLEGIFEGDTIWLVMDGLMNFLNLFAG